MKKTINLRWCTYLIITAILLAVLFTGTCLHASADADVFDKVELKVGETLGFIYYTTEPYNENATMKFEINGRFSESPAYPNDDKCVFVFGDIYPHELAKEVKATLLINGKETVSSSGLSMKKYLLQILLDSTQSPQMHRLASNILQYGEATRLYRNANVPAAERDPNTLLDFDTSIYKNYQPDDLDAFEYTETDGLGVSTANIRLSSIGIAYYNYNEYVLTLQTTPNSSIPLDTVKVKVGNVEYTSKDFTQKNENTYEVRTKPVYGYAIASPVDIILTVNGSVAQKAKYSPADYAYQLYVAGGDALALRYAKALCLYGAASGDYSGNTVMSITTIENPKDIQVSNKSAYIPQGGKIRVYYVDGTYQDISTGISWSQKDINGNDVAITDDTYEKVFTVTGTYQDVSNNKIFSCTADVKLLNPLQEIKRYTDCTTYSPTTYAAQYTPTGGKIQAVWKNGYTAVRSDNLTFSKVSMNSYRYIEQAQIPVKVQYTDPKSQISKDTTLYFIYSNPITKVQPADFSATMTNASTNVPLPDNTVLTITYSNNKSCTTSDASAWQWNHISYTGADTTATITATGVLTTGCSDTYQYYENGSEKTAAWKSSTITGACTATISNPETGIIIKTPPTLKGGSVVSAAAPKSGDNEGDLIGGETHVIMSNGATKKVTNTAALSYQCNSGISTSVYSAVRTVTATYTTPTNETFTNNTNITLYNLIESVEQTVIPEIFPNSTAPNTPLTLNDTSGTLTVTYRNGKTRKVKPTQFIINNIAIDKSSACYIESVTTAVITSTVRSTATLQEDGTEYYPLIVSYVDTRSNSPQTVYTCNYECKVSVILKGVLPNQSKAPVTLNADGTIPTPTNSSLWVQYSNGTSRRRPFSFNPINATIGAQEETVCVVTGYHTYTYEGTEYICNITEDDNITCTVINPAVSAVTYTDVTPSEVDSNGAPKSLQGGVLTITFTNGTTANVDCTDYTDIPAITDNSFTSRKAITGVWKGTHSQVAAADMYIILYNPITEITQVTLTGKGSSESNRISLSSQSVSGTIASITVSLANGKTRTGNPDITNVDITLSSYTDTTTTEIRGSGTCNVKVRQKNVIYSSHKTNGTATNKEIKFNPQSKSVTLYWENKPTNLTIYTNSTMQTAASNTTGQSIDEYVALYFYNHNNSDYKIEKCYPRITLANGKKVTNGLTCNIVDASGAKITHKASSCYRNGDTFTSDSIIAAKCSVTYKEVKLAQSLLVVPYATAEYCYAAHTLKLKHQYNESHGVKPSCWQVKMQWYATYSHQATGTWKALSENDYYLSGNDYQWFLYWNGTTGARPYYSNDTLDSQAGVSRASLTGIQEHTSLPASVKRSDAYISCYIPSATKNGKSWSAAPNPFTYSNTQKEISPAWSYITRCGYMGYFTETS